MALDFSPSHAFKHRHIGPGREDASEMLRILREPALEAFIDKVVPLPSGCGGRFSWTSLSGNPPCLRG